MIVMKLDHVRILNPYHGREKTTPSEATWLGLKELSEKGYQGI